MLHKLWMTRERFRNTLVCPAPWDDYPDPCWVPVRTSSAVDRTPTVSLSRLSVDMIAVYVFLVIFTGQLISWVGKTQLSEWAHALYLFLTRSPLARTQRNLRTTVLKTKSELQATSSQDEFAKWARLRRKMDKELQELDTLNKQIASDRTQFSALFSTLLWVFTSGLQFLLVSWYRTNPVFFLPTGWFPPTMVWLLGFPSAPYGAVSTTVWALVCKRALSVSVRMIGDSFGLFTGPDPPATSSPKQPPSPAQS
ncbi:hypothetical protein CROQUDRAFT_668226 [Cronartium quercuum f. sp. fusiforme G11]|uniref:Guided entry of tail-anchored proteins 1 n=1 Tax=Cronartium quercuum f. sp. fusiforme G11 TaxID=708437 RepID=A0A9P6NWT7_9BASI|nr:hypothetical protein CROQUDRAFT_668226 [Cronartium quercuum f. sp. fusiforme G11]